MCTGCPRAHVYEAALQLLQVLDKRFFGNINPLPTDGDTSSVFKLYPIFFVFVSILYFLDLQRTSGTLDVLLSRTYCRSQSYLSQQLSQLHPELTMPMFSGDFLFNIHNV
jgi:hypothetical protein